MARGPRRREREVPGYAGYWLFLRFLLRTAAPVTRGAGRLRSDLPEYRQQPAVAMQSVSAIINCV